MHWQTHKPVCRAIKADIASESGPLGVDGKPKEACDACSADLVGGGSRCGTLFFAAYCSAPCQSAHSAKHKLVCASVRGARIVRLKKKAEDVDKARKLEVHRAHALFERRLLCVEDFESVLRDFPGDLGLTFQVYRGICRLNGDARWAVIRAHLVILVKILIRLFAHWQWRRRVQSIRAGPTTQ